MVLCLSDGMSLEARSVDVLVVGTDWSEGIFTGCRGCWCGSECAVLPIERDEGQVSEDLERGRNDMRSNISQ